MFLKERKIVTTKKGKKRCFAGKEKDLLSPAEQDRQRGGELQSCRSQGGKGRKKGGKKKTTVGGMRGITKKILIGAMLKGNKIENEETKEKEKGNDQEGGEEGMSSSLFS